MNITSINKKHRPAYARSTNKRDVFDRCPRRRSRRVKLIEPKAAFAERIARNKQYRHWVVVHLFRNGQTPHEQTFHVTRELNGVGFSAPDAPLLSAFAEMIEPGKSLTANEEVVLGNKLTKYWRQFSGASPLEPPGAVISQKPIEAAVTKRRMSGRAA